VSQIQILLVAWAIVTILALLLGYLSFYFREASLKKLSLADFINLALASAAIISSLSLMYRAATSQEFIKLLQFEIVTLFLGAIAVIWISIQQILQIFK
jgi:hypothetical protein